MTAEQQSGLTEFTQHRLVDTLTFTYINYFGATGSNSQEVVQTITNSLLPSGFIGLATAVIKLIMTRKST